VALHLLVKYFLTSITFVYILKWHYISCSSVLRFIARIFTLYCIVIFIWYQTIYRKNVYSIHIHSLYTLHVCYKEVIDWQQMFSRINQKFKLKLTHKELLKCIASYCAHPENCYMLIWLQLDLIQTFYEINMFTLQIIYHLHYFRGWNINLIIFEVCYWINLTFISKLFIREQLANSLFLCCNCTSFNLWL